MQDPISEIDKPDLEVLETLRADRKPYRTDVLGIEGMTCDECVQKIENSLKNVNGVQSVQVDREKAVATVTYDSRKTDVPTLHDALLNSGYKPTRQAS
jgi:copper chaperone